MAEPRTIFVFLAGALGDFVNAIPALSALRCRYASSRIELAGNPAWLPLAEAASLVDRVHSIEALPLSEGFQRPLPVRGGLARFLEPFELVLSWFGDREGTWAEGLSKLCPGQVLVFPFHRHMEFPGHISDFFLYCLQQALGIRPEPATPPRLALPKAAEGSTGIETSPPGLSEDPYVCIHPGSGGRHKNWPQDRFLEVAQGIRSRADAPRVRILLGPAEDECRPFWAGRAACGIEALGGLDVLELATVLAGADGYLGNDSGVTHLAAALDVPTVALFGPTDPSRWGPRGPNVRILQSKAGCAPCAGRPTGQCGLECLRAIEAGEVLAALEEARKRRGADRTP